MGKTKANSKACSPRAKLLPLDRAKLQVETGFDSYTIRRWEKGEPVRPSTHIALVRACSRYGLEVIA